MPEPLRRFTPFSRGQLVLLGLMAAAPLFGESLAASGRTVVVYAILALGLNIVVGWTGLLHLGIAAFAAIGAYAYGILTCEIYPFQLGFWGGLAAAAAFGAVAGALLGAPTLRLRGDYLAIVTLGFGEIVQDALKNLDTITKGTQGINPLPGATVPGVSLLSSASQVAATKASSVADGAAVSGTDWLGWLQISNETPVRWYFLYLVVLAAIVFLCRNLEFSRLGR